jgi:tRNA modification GTPase
MALSLNGDTIVAVATAAGAGAVAIVRMSGADAIRIGGSVFRGRIPLEEAGGYTVHHGHIVGEAGDMVDEVLVTVFRSPRSYTGEDMVEVSCHGGMLVTASVLGSLVRAGARPAGPGEFTRRAFLNGRIDLTQAEAVADVIVARSVRGHRASMSQLAGRLGGRVRELRESLVSLCALLELQLDFAEEGLDIVNAREADRKLESAAVLARTMAESYEKGRVFRDGILVVIAGAPNAGKSSLFNALLQSDRAIVTPTPGTTRDFIEESMTIEGISVRLVDTAGLRETQDEIERAGVVRTESVLKSADVILLVVDSTSPIAFEEASGGILDAGPEQHRIAVLNKIDILELSNQHAAHARMRDGESWDVRLSARTGKGIEELRKAIVESVVHSAGSMEDDVVVTSRRHQDALERAYRGLTSARVSLLNGNAVEFVAFDVREAINALAEITGEVTGDDVLNMIFAKFCIGK